MYPAGIPRPVASNLQLHRRSHRGQPRHNPGSARCRVTLFNSVGTTHVLADVVGFYTDDVTHNGGRFVPLSPNGSPTPEPTSGSRTATSTFLEWNVALVGSGRVAPADVGAVVTNVTVTEPYDPGWLIGVPRRRLWRSRQRVEPQLRRVADGAQPGRSPHCRPPMNGCGRGAGAHQHPARALVGRGHRRRLRLLHRSRLRPTERSGWRRSTCVPGPLPLKGCAAGPRGPCTLAGDGPRQRVAAPRPSRRGGGRRARSSSRRSRGWRAPTPRRSPATR